MNIINNKTLLQNLNIMEGDLPENTDDLTITGAGSLIIETNALSRLNDARYLHFSNNKLILIRTSSAVSLNTVSLFLEIDNCEVLNIEEKAFTNIKGIFFINFICLICIKLVSATSEFFYKLY